MAVPGAGVRGVRLFLPPGGFENVNQTSADNDRAVISSQVDDSLAPRVEASRLYSQTITQQEKMVATLESLKVCQESQGNSSQATATGQEIVIEQDILMSLQDKLTANEDYIVSLSEVRDSLLADTSDSASLAFQLGNIRQIIDPQTAQSVLDDASTEASNITAITDRIDSAKSQNSCSPTAPSI